MESWVWRGGLFKNIWFIFGKRKVRPRAAILASVKLSMLDMQVKDLKEF